MRKTLVAALMHTTPARWRQTFRLVVLVLALMSSASAQGKRAVTFDDVLAIKAVGGATLSPDGSQVLYTVRQWVAEKERMEARTHIWQVATNGATPARQITSGEKGDSQPQWSPDGRFISFVSARGSGEDVKAQVYVMRADGGEAWAVTSAKEGVANQQAYSWSPDSARLAFVTTDPRSAGEEADLKKRDDERVFEGDFRYAHVWVVPVGPHFSAASATRITEGTTYTVAGAPSWAPDGKRFVFGAGATPMLREIGRAHV